MHEPRLTPVPLARQEPAPRDERPLVNAEPVPNELLHLWTMLTQREKWSSLVVVPAQPGASGLEAARAIVSVGNQYRERPVRLLNAEGLRPGAASRLVRDLRAYVEQGGMIVTCIDSIITNPVGLELALAAERALLCVPLGSTEFSAARRTLERIGKARFLGSVCTRPAGS
jgi:hypothetical protein